MTKRTFQAAAIAAMLIAGAAAAPVLAQDKMPDVRVRYSDLDLSKPSDLRIFDRRLDYATKAACPDEDGVRDLSRLRPIRRCQADKRAEVAPLRATALAAAQNTKSTLTAAR